MTGRPWEQRLILESTIRSHENTGSTSSQEGEQGSQLLGFPGLWGFPLDLSLLCPLLAKDILFEDVS